MRQHAHSTRDAFCQMQVSLECNATNFHTSWQAKEQTRISRRHAAVAGCAVGLAPVLLVDTVRQSVTLRTEQVEQVKLLSSCRRAAVAGCAAGLAPVLALHPLDVIKTRLQGELLGHAATETRV